MSGERVPVGFVGPRKTFSEMTDDERRDFFRAAGDRFATPHAAAKARTDADRAADNAEAARPTGSGEHEQAIRPSTREKESRSGDQMRSCHHTVERLEQWARIRRAAGEDVTICGAGGASMRKSRLFFRLMTLDRDPLPLPPPRAMSGPWYAVVEDGCADLGGECEPVDDDRVSVWGDSRWRVLQTIEPGRAHVVTHPGAIGRWSLTRVRGHRDGAKDWRLSRISADPAAGWGPYIDHIALRLERYFEREAEEEHLIVVVEGMGNVYVQFALFDRGTALRYEAVGEVHLDDPAAFPGLRARLEALGFTAPGGKASDDSDPENYVRRCDAPVDVRALATDAVIVLQEAYGVMTDRTISVKSAVWKTHVP